MSGPRHRVSIVPHLYYGETLNKKNNKPTTKCESSAAQTQNNIPQNTGGKMAT
jgi:hypothetical protein